MPVQIQVLADFTPKQIGLEDVELAYFGDFRHTLFQDLSMWVDARSRRDGMMLLDAYQNYNPKRNSEVPLLDRISREGNKNYLLSSKGEYKFIGMVRNYVPKSTSKECADYILRKVNLLAVGGVVESTDNEIMVMTRGKKVDVPGKLLPSPAGNMEYSDDLKRMPTLSEELYLESNEEVGLVRDDYVEIKPVGIVKDLKDSFNPVVCYSMKSNLTTKKVVERFREAIKKNQFEDKDINPVKLDEKNIVKFVAENSDRLVGNGAGMIMLKCKYDFGNKWYDQAVKSLNDNFVFTYQQKASTTNP